MEGLTFLVRVERGDVGRVKVELGRVRGVARCVPARSQAVRRLREADVVLYLDGQPGALAVQPRLHTRASVSAHHEYRREKRGGRTSQSTLSSARILSSPPCALK